jgi:hypothetical protein
VSAFLYLQVFEDTEGANAYLTNVIKYSGSTKTNSDTGVHPEFFIWEGGGDLTLRLCIICFVLKFYFIKIMS